MNNNNNTTVKNIITLSIFIVCRFDMNILEYAIMITFCLFKKTRKKGSKTL